MIELVLALLCGLAGGLARATQGGRLILPSRDTNENGKDFLDPGLFGTVFVGLVAGLAAWLFNPSVADPGIDLRPLGWALIAGVGGDIALNFYVNQKLGVADRQDAGELLDTTADTANSATQELKQAHEERRKLQETIDNQQAKISALQAENERLKSGTSKDQ